MKNSEFVGKNEKILPVSETSIVSIENLEQESTELVKKFEENNRKINKKFSELPPADLETFGERYEKIKSDIYNTILKLESYAVWVTQNAFVPETIKKVRLLKKLTGWFKPHAYTEGGLLSDTRYANDFKQIQLLDEDYLRKLLPLKDFVSIHREDFPGLGNYGHGTYDCTVGFRKHIKSFDTKIIADSISKLPEDVKYKNSDGGYSLDGCSLNHSGIKFYAMNFDQISNKEKLARFSMLLRDYYDNITQRTSLTDGRPDQFDCADPYKFEKFFLENSKLNITDDDIEKILTNTEPEKVLGEMLPIIHPWYKKMMELRNIQKQPERVIFNPWVIELIPLLTKFGNEGLISFDSQDDADIVLRYVKTYGMFNAPNLFELFITLSRCSNLNEISPKIQYRLKEELNIDIEEIKKQDPLNISLIISKSLEYKKSLHEDFKKEDPELISKIENSAYAAELFSTLKAKSPWQEIRKYTDIGLISRFEKTKKKNPEIFALKEGYTPTTFLVPEVGVEAPNFEEKEKEYLNNQQIREQLNFFRAVFEKAERDPLEPQSFKEGIINKVQKELEKSKKIALDDYESVLKNNGSNDKAIFGAKKKIEDIESLNLQLTQFAQKFTERGVDVLNELTRLLPKKLPGTREVLIRASLMAMNEKFPSLILSLRSLNSYKGDRDFLNTVTDFMTLYVREHLLDREHDPDLASKIGREEQKSLEKVWALSDGHILMHMKEELDRLKTGGVTGKQRTITLIPSKGIQRVFSSDTGRTCSTEQSIDFAKGEYSNITSYSLILDEGKKQERFAGSFLVIEAKSENGEPVLILRANNPAENLSFTVDSDVLVESIINEVKNVAERRGIKKVAVPLDDSGQASSNRSFVSLYYARKFGGNEKIGLIENDETTFNEYPVWDKNSKHGVVKI